MRRKEEKKMRRKEGRKKKRKGRKKKEKKKKEKNSEGGQTKDAFSCPSLYLYSCTRCIFFFGICFINGF